MKNQILNLKKIPKPLCYNKNNRKLIKKENSSNYKGSKSIKKIYSKYDNNNNVYIEAYKRTRSPVTNNLNSTLPFKLNKINLQNDLNEKINLDFKNLSFLFNININNVIDIPDFNDEKILDFNIYTPIIEDNNSDNKNNINNDSEEELSPICKYGLRYINYDIYNKTIDKSNKAILIQSFLRGFFLRKKINLNMLNKEYLENRNTKLIIFLQKNIRTFLAKLKIRKKIIMNYINQRRKKAINIIINNMRSYNNILKTKKLLFIKNKLVERNKYAKYIQETFRNFKFYNSFKKFMKELNEKYSIIYPSKGNKVELIIYLEENNNLIPKKYIFNYNKILKCFVLFINPNKLFSGKYKCQFIIDDIVICDRNYPYAQYNNELYNIIEFKLNRNKKVEKRKKRKLKNNINKIVDNIGNMKKNMKNINYNRIFPNIGIKYKNNFYQSEKNYNEFEYIKKDIDEKRSYTSRETINELNNSKRTNREFINEDLDFTEEDIINIKKLRGNKIIVTDYQKLIEELLNKNPINKFEKIKRASFKSFNCNY